MTFTISYNTSATLANKWEIRTDPDFNPIATFAHRSEVIAFIKRARSTVYEGIKIQTRMVGRNVKP